VTSVFIFYVTCFIFLTAAFFLSAETVVGL
jgi:hypothetical protein